VTGPHASLTEPPPSPGPLNWAGIALITLCALGAGVLEVLFVPLYIGSVVLPIAVVFSLWSNIALPRMAYRLVPTMIACALPFLGWLVVVIGFGVVGRPEGDVILPGGTDAVHWVSYGVMLGGALAGTISVVTAVPPRAPGPSVSR
jgi:hypothetical protein